MRVPIMQADTHGEPDVLVGSAERSGPADVDSYPLRAVIFDLDALADIERDGHRVAFNAAFAAHGLDIEWSTSAGTARLLALRDERSGVTAPSCGRVACAISATC